MWTLILLGTLLSATLAGISMLRSRLQHHKELQQASAMAISGQDYARALLSKHQWPEAPLLRSPDFPGGGRFEVEIRDGKIRSTGFCGKARQALEGPL
ncbi:MAG: hypothetical protein J0I12_01415 [Candidatus Eremiobacteraeota bacterium]|nr:hypothetical protein [Candidatus Eremiobacteraeota bacterium]